MSKNRHRVRQPRVSGCHPENGTIMPLWGIAFRGLASTTADRRVARIDRAVRVLRHAVGILSLLVAWNVAAAGGDPGVGQSRIQRVFDELHARYPDRVDDDALANRAIIAMLGSLDPYSTLLDRNAYLAFQQQERGLHVGVGVEVEFDRDSLMVRDSAVDSPGFEAGLRTGDRITRLDGVSLIGLSLDQALHLAQGDIGSNLNLTVLRRGEEVPRTVNVRRSLLPVPTVRARRLATAIGYIRIERFRQSTPQGVHRALQHLAAPGEPPLTGLVLDLRGNPGGSVRAAVGVAEAFLPPETLVVSLEGPGIGADSRLFTMRRQAARPVSGGIAADGIAADGIAFARSLPMVVLIDAGSASAAEILAGALQDYRRALLVGTTTYGKGSVQSILPLGDGTALKLTVARYLTPAGRAVHGKGIEPDIRVEVTSKNDEGDEHTDRPLDEARRILDTCKSAGVTAGALRAADLAIDPQVNGPGLSPR